MGLAGLDLRTKAARLRNPMASDGSKPRARGNRRSADLSHQARGDREAWAIEGKLNPRFVEWLMGLPPNWVSISGE